MPPQLKGLVFSTIKGRQRLQALKQQRRRAMEQHSRRLLGEEESGGLGDWYLEAVKNGFMGDCYTKEIPYT